MNVDLENQFFGSFIAFIIGFLLQYCNWDIIAAVVVVIIISFVVILLHRSLYSLSQTLSKRILFHIINLFCSALVFPFLSFYLPTSFPINGEGYFLSSVLVATITAWIIVTEINRKSMPETFQSTEELYFLT